MKPIRQLLTMLVLLLAAGLLSACGEKKEAFRNTDISGVDYAGDFALTDHHGKLRRLADFKGKAVILFFGYTQCPDVCPTTLSEMAAVKKELGPLGDQIQVLFVTIDPQRDSRELLANYVPAFDPGFIGLSGNEAEITRTAKDFKVFFQKVPGKTSTSYTMDHSAGSFVFDRQGRIRLFVRNGQGPEPITHDLKILLKD